MRYLVGHYDVSARRACRVLRTTRSSTYYKSRRDPLTALRQRLRELAQTRVRFGLALFNDAILRTAVDLGLDVLELRSICTEPEDYANPIEPSGQGGLKIARAVSRLVGAVDCGGVLPGRV